MRRLIALLLVCAASAALWASLDRPIIAPNFTGVLKGVAYTPSHLYTEVQKDEVITDELIASDLKQISKIASRYLEEAKVAVRNVRRHGLDELKKFEKDGKVSQDESKKITKEIQDMTDSYVKKMDESFAHKEKEILQV